MIDTRDDLDLDWDQVYAEAARTGTALEMNGSPHRLDLAVERARRAVADGCLLSIDSDAHRTDELDYVRWGISQARRAWVEPANVVNTRDRDGAARLGRREAGADMNLSRTIPAMDERNARRDLALAAVTIVGLSRLLEPPALWLVAILLLIAMLFGTLQVLADLLPPSEAAAGVPIESLILPSVSAVACLGAIRLVPFGLWLVPALLLTAYLVSRSLVARGADPPRPGGPDAGRPDVGAGHDPRRGLHRVHRASRRSCPGGLAQPVGSGATPKPIPEGSLLILAAGDAVIAFLLGYRAAALRLTNLRDAFWSALTYAAAIAIGAAAIRAMAIPRLIGPALLTLAFYLWDAIHGSLAGAPPRLRLALADRAAGRARDHRGRLEPAAPRARRRRTRGRGAADV